MPQKNLNSRSIPEGTMGPIDSSRLGAGLDAQIERMTDAQRAELEDLTPEQALQRALDSGRWIVYIGYIDSEHKGAQGEKLIRHTRQWKDFDLADMPECVKHFRDGISRALRESSTRQLELSEEAIKMRVQV
jgi:hypothetical protein